MHNQACSNRTWISPDLPFLSQSFQFSGYLCIPPMCFPILHLFFLWVPTLFDTKMGCDPFVSCFQEITGSVFYLILDVVDTECHVRSKKLWKNCNTRPAHSTVRILFFYLISHMMSYSGTTDNCKIPTLAFLVGNLGKNQSPFYNIHNFTLYLLISLQTDKIYFKKWKWKKSFWPELIKRPH